MHESLRRVFGRLAVQVALGSMLVILIVGVFAVARLDAVLTQNEESRVRTDLLRARDRFAVQFDIYRDFALITTSWVAEAESVRSAVAAGEADLAIQNAGQAYSMVAAAGGAEPHLSLFDADGIRIAGAHPPSTEAPEEVQRVLAAGIPLAGVKTDEFLGPAIVAASPMTGPGGERIGVLEIAFPIDGRLVDDYVRGIGIGVTFVSGGRALVTSHPGFGGMEEWPALGNGDSGTITDDGGESYLAAITPAESFDGTRVGDFYLLVPEQVIADGVAAARRDLILLTGGAVGLATLLTLAVAWFTTRPLRDLVVGARRIQGNDLEAAVRVSGTGEIRALGEAMEDMRVAIRQSRESLLSANRELATRVDLSTSSLAEATNELVMVHEVLARLEEAPSGDLSGVAGALAELDWVDGVVIALRSRDGHLAVAASTRLAPGATVDLIDVVNMRLTRDPFTERWHVPVTLDEPRASRLASRRIGGFVVELMTTSEGIAGFAAVTAMHRLNMTPERETVLRAVAREVALNLERRELEEVVAENRRIAESVLREMSDGVLVLDHVGVCRICNPAAARMLGHSSEDVVGRDVTYYLPLSGEVLDTMRTRTAKYPEAATAPVVTELNGKRIAVTASLYPDAESAADGMILLVRDLSAEAEVERVRRDFVSIVGHELRTPLTLIRTSVDLLHEGDAGELNETQGRLVEVLRNNSERMTRLINDLVDVSSLDPGRLEIRPGWLDISDVVREVAESLNRDASARRHTLSVDVPDTAMVWADPNRIRQVLTNLVSNAIKYTPEGGAVSIAVDPGDELVQVTVTDNGIGIKSEEQALLFERFYRAPSGRRMSNGAGLGLPIAKALIELHGGTIRGESNGESGSKFTFTLPRKPLGSEEPLATAGEPAPRS